MMMMMMLADILKRLVACHEHQFCWDVVVHNNDVPMFVNFIMIRRIMIVITIIIDIIS